MQKAFWCLQTSAFLRCFINMCICYICVCGLNKKKRPSFVLRSSWSCHHCQACTLDILTIANAYIMLLGLGLRIQLRHGKRVVTDRGIDRFGRLHSSASIIIMLAS